MIATASPSRYRRLVIVLLGMMSAWASPALGQYWDNAMARPSEYGIRLTPEIARGMGKAFTREVLVREYELDEAKAEEAAELIARQLMKAAHEHDAAARDLLEFAFAGILVLEAERQTHGVPREIGIGVGKRILPMLPAVREVLKNVGQDIRPMLSLKQQLKFGAELMVAHTAMDAFSKNMEEWAKGNVDPFANPFKSQDEEVERDENGDSRALKGARDSAQRMVDGRWRSAWEKYVTEAKEFYDFDESQSATADSILRETIQRAEVIAQDELRRQRIYRNRLWSRMLWEFNVGWHNPLRTRLDYDYSAMLAPMLELADELKQRIDDIPTEAQRKAADQRIMKALADMGIDLNEVGKD